ncbi:FecR domain-containing protein [Stieleria mannarensis]|uniref:FecR domain-containing protein n=1 Tax=Stieleria mannarensis TaxID=2755585 RepID=UPI0015FF6608|nr:FecR domain-containing protein [Rhodopirellula sp. JC639]
MSGPNGSETMPLFEAVHDQIASDEDVAALDDWLRDNPDGQRQYLEFVDMQHEIERQIAGVFSRGPDSRTENATSKAAADGFLFPIHSVRWKVFAIAASLLAAVGIGWWGNSRLDDKPIAAIDLDASPVSRVLGIVTASENGLAYSGRRKLESGSALRSGRVDLQSGSMKIRMESGVELFLAGPSQIEMNDPLQVQLVSGTVTAEVPDSVIGFAVKVPGLNVVDLGTSFGVSLPANGQAKVHVFDGVVDAEVERSQQRVRLKDRQTVLFDGTSVAESSYDQDLFVQPGMNRDAIPTTTGDVRFLHTPPTSVRVGQFEHDLVLCFKERTESTLLETDLPVSLDAPGHYRVKPRWQNFGAVPRGTLVDSYFIHLDAIGPEKRTREGSITFNRPILGVVFSSSLLKGQNEIFGDPRTAYVTDRTNPKSDPTLENETITLSADRRTIRFSWRIRSRSDQVRVFVAADR